jgi:tetratricopeptide (TPR) repeat protein
MRPRFVWLVGGLTLISAGCQTFAPRTSAPAAELTPSQSGLKSSRVETSPSETAKLRFATAQQLEAGGKLADAIALYDNARQADPRYFVAATRKLGILYDQQGDFDKARAEYEKLLTKAPNDADTLNNLGYGYYCRGQWSLAEEQLRKAVAANPEHKRAWINLGMTLAQQAQYDQCLDAFAKAIPPAQGHCNLAFVLTTQGKREEAKQAYREALRIDPGLQLAQVALAKLERPTPSAARKSEIPTSERHVQETEVAFRSAAAEPLDETPVVVDPAALLPANQEP